MRINNNNSNNNNNNNNNKKNNYACSEGPVFSHHSSKRKTNLSTNSPRSGTHSYFNERVHHNSSCPAPDPHSCLYTALPSEEQRSASSKSKHTRLLVGDPTGADPQGHNFFKYADTQLWKTASSSFAGLANEKRSRIQSFSPSPGGDI